MVFLATDPHTLTSLHMNIYASFSGRLYHFVSSLVYEDEYITCMENVPGAKSQILDSGDSKHLYENNSLFSGHVPTSHPMVDALANGLFSLIQDVDQVTSTPSSPFSSLQIYPIFLNSLSVDELILSWLVPSPDKGEGLS